MLNMALTEEQKKLLQTANARFEAELQKRKLRQELNNAELIGAITDAIKSVEINVPEPKQAVFNIPEIKVPQINVPEIKSPNITIPEIKLPEIRVPEIKLPVFKVPKPEVTVNVPEIKIPTIEVPETIVSIPENLSVSLKDVDRNNPLHVILTDSKGLPYSAQPIITGSGGGAGVMTGFDGSGNKKVLVDTDGKLIINVASSDITLETRQVSGSVDSVAVNSIAADQLIQVRQVSGSSDSVSASIDAQTTTLIVDQLSGSTWSTTVVSGATSLDIKQVSGSTDSINIVSTVDLPVISGTSSLDIRQVSGSVDSVVVNSFLTSLDVKQISGSADSINVTQLGGNTIATGNGDTDSGTLRIVKVASSNSTTAAVSVGADASTNIVPTNLGRRSIIITHASGSNLYVATGTAASTTSIPLVTNQSITFDDYTGPINAIAEEQAGTISVRYIEIV